LKPNVRPRLTEQQSSVHGRLGLDKPDFVRQPSVIPDSSHSLRHALLDKVRDPDSDRRSSLNRLMELLVLTLYSNTIFRGED
jgi:hypothetical protein